MNGKMPTTTGIITLTRISSSSSILIWTTTTLGIGIMTNTFAVQRNSSGVKGEALTTSTWPIIIIRLGFKILGNSEIKLCQEDAQGRLHFILKIYRPPYYSMEININFRVPASASASEVLAILSRVMVDIAVNDADGRFGPAGYTIIDDGATVATYRVDAEYDGEVGWPFDCNDMSDDGCALASAGFGTDEDYGYYGEGDDW
jgi:hypothetical protein